MYSGLLTKIFILGLIIKYCHCGKKTTKSKDQNGRFHVGRHLPGLFEHPDLARITSPKRAKEECEGNIECAGFTFKGTKDLDSETTIFFFRFINVSNVEVKGFLHWTTYKVGRSFVVVPGTFGASKKEVSAKENIQYLDAFKRLLQEKCPFDEKRKDGKMKWGFTHISGIQMNTENNEVFSYDEIDFADLKLSPETGVFTFINLKSDRIRDSSLDRQTPICCKKSEVHQENFYAVGPGQISCGELKIFKQMITERTPIVLNECIDHCLSIEWSFKDVVQTFKRHAEFQLKERNEKQFRANSAKSVVDKLANEAVEIRTTISHPESWINLIKFVTGFDESDSRPKLHDVLDGFSEESTKRELIWRRAQIGASVFQNPRGMDTLYTVTKGKEKLTFIPVQDIIRNKKFSCRPDCSDDMSISTWIKEMSRKFISQSFHGKYITSLIINSGDTVFIPNEYDTIVEPLEDSLALTESTMTPHCLEDIIVHAPKDTLNSLKKWFQMSDLKRNEYHRLQDVLKQIMKAPKKS